MTNNDAERRIGHLQRYKFAPPAIPRDGDLVMRDAPDGHWLMYSDVVQLVGTLLRERDEAVNRLSPVGHALEMIRDGGIPQGMTPGLFAEKVLGGGHEP